MKAGLTKYMDEVLAECSNRIVGVARHRDLNKALGFPSQLIVPVPKRDLMPIACKARREGARSRAEALEWAYDSLIRKSGYTRVGEVYGRRYSKVPHYEALVIERDPLD